MLANNLTGVSPFDTPLPVVALELTPRPAHRENPIGHIDPHEPTVPDVAAQNSVERCENLINRRTHHGALEQYRKPPHEDPKIGEHRCAQRDLAAQAAYAPALGPCRLELQLVE